MEMIISLVDGLIESGIDRLAPSRSVQSLYGLKIFQGMSELFLGSQRRFDLPNSHNRFARVISRTACCLEMGADHGIGNNHVDLLAYQSIRIEHKAR